MLNANIIISAIYSPNGTAFQAFQKASEAPYMLALCDQIIDEIWTGVLNISVAGVQSIVGARKRR